MDITGKVIHISAEQTGQGKNGNWRKLEFVIETQSQYPKKVCFSIWGDRIDQANLKVGEDVTVSFDPESREYNGKWYTDLRAWRVQKAAAGDNTNPNPANKNTSQENYSVNTNYNDEVTDDLPF